MKSENVVTYYFDENGEPDRLRDKLVKALERKRCIEVGDEWAIERDMPDGSTRMCGVFATVMGPRLLVDFLSWLTNIHLGKVNHVSVTTDGKGTIKSAKDLSG